VPDFGAWVPDSSPRDLPPPPRAFERVSAGVPWPRGIVFVEDRLVVLARGRHRRAGGIDPRIRDHSGSLFTVDPRISETVRPGRLASNAVIRNAALLAPPADPPFHLYDGRTEPIEAVLLDRPYCTLVYDRVSRNFFVCGYSGVDLPGARFRKNATDSVLRFDLRTERWSLVEGHDPRSVRREELGYVVPNDRYPHADPKTSLPPHGWLNGPNGACVSGRYLLVCGKDNHLVAAYDLRGIRKDPRSGPPRGLPVLGPDLEIETPLGRKKTRVLGPSALARWGDHLYVGYRTSSIVLRFDVDERGLPRKETAALCAVFEPWDPETKRSANLIDMDFDSRGRLYVACAKSGRIWCIGVPDPSRPFYGNDRGTRKPSAPPFLDLAVLTGKKTSCANICFDPEDRLYICAGNYDTASAKIAGVIYRALPGIRKRRGD